MTTILHNDEAAPGAEVHFSDEQAVVLHVKGGDYAVPISRVQEIVRVPQVTHIPEAEDDVEGVINLRGKVLPVVNLRGRLGLGAREIARDSRVVVVEGSQGRVGLLVDGVSEVLTLLAGDMEPPSPVTASRGRRSVRGVARIGERLILLLDLDATLATPEYGSVAAI